MTKKILILPGDGIGQEVTSSMSEVLHYLIDEQSLDFQISERKVGGSSYDEFGTPLTCLLYTSPSPRDLSTSRMPSSA